MDGCWELQETEPQEARYFHPSEYLQGSQSAGSHTPLYFSPVTVNRYLLRLHGLSNCSYFQYVPAYVYSQRAADHGLSAYCYY